MKTVHGPMRLLSGTYFQIRVVMGLTLHVLQTPKTFLKTLN